MWPSPVLRKGILDSALRPSFDVYESAKGHRTYSFGWVSLANLFNCSWHRIILRPGRLGSIVEVERIKGPTFNSKEEAERLGL